MSRAAPTTLRDWSRLTRGVRSMSLATCCGQLGVCVGRAARAIAFVFSPAQSSLSPWRRGDRAGGVCLPPCRTIGSACAVRMGAGIRAGCLVREQHQRGPRRGSSNVCRVGGSRSCDWLPLVAAARRRRAAQRASLRTGGHFQVRLPDRPRGPSQQDDGPCRDCVSGYAWRRPGDLPPRGRHRGRRRAADSDRHHGWR